MIRIAEVEAGTLAEELELEIGTRIIRINGERVRDNIDLTFMLSENELELETVTPGGEAIIYEISKDPGEPVGIVPAPDTIRECGNKCVFCFIDGNPRDVRPSLWLRDDDFRLSFTYGSYVTLTNLGPKGLRRLVDQRLSPLYVSVHATEPQVRIDLLKNERAGLIMDQLRYLTDHGLEVHTQVVLCPEWNEGAHLDRTLEDLWQLGEGIRSCSVVPVGLTRYNLERPVRLLRPDEAAHAIAQVDRARERGLRERGEGWAYIADEMYLIAGLELPGSTYYDDGALTENGVGAVRLLLDEFESGVDGLPKLEAHRVRIATGASMAPFFRERAPRMAEATGAEIDIVQVPSDFYGPSVTTAGLIAGVDLIGALRPDVRPGDVCLVPAEALNADHLFIDSIGLDEVRAALDPAPVIPAYDLIDGLREAARAVQMQGAV